MLTVDADRRVLHRGAVYIHDGVIETVRPEQAAPPAGFGAAHRVRTGGLITPGLIDLHNHLAYNTLPLWTGREAAYSTRYQWPGAPTYQSDVSNPAQALGIAAPAAALRFAEVKAVVGGVTAIQGSPPVDARFPGMDGAQRREGGDRCQEADLPVGAAGDCRSTRHDSRPHGAEAARSSTTSREGVDPALRKEFTLLARSSLRR